MTQWNQIEDVLRRHHVTDVLVPGLIDRDEGPFPMFRPQPLVVHVVLGDEQALRLESVGQNDQLTVRVVDSISLEGVEFFERVEEETDDEIAQASWGNSFSGTVGPSFGVLSPVRTRMAGPMPPRASSSVSPSNSSPATGCSSIRPGPSALRSEPPKTCGVGSRSTR
ncbi:hypothetical protein ACFQYP_54315 [Nonomuraea antimicrobica]